MSEIVFIDTTLRDGEQSPGVCFNKTQKLDIASRLSFIGVQIIEAGIPAMGEGEIEVLSEINQLNLKSQILNWCRMKTEDIDDSLKSGIKNVHVALPVSDYHIAKKFNQNRQWLLKNSASVISYAKEKGCEISIGLEDASRADLKFIIKIINFLSDFSIARFRFSDTLGKETPFSVFKKIKRIKNECDVVLEFHGHNDFGMATANALAALEGGASHLSVSVNGLGERAGNTPLEEIALALKYLQNKKLNIDFKKLKELSEKIEEYSGIRLSKLKPVFGEHAFTHESGIHVNGIIKSSDVYSLFPPEEIGLKTRIVLGKHSGISSIRYILERQGIAASAEEINMLKKIIDEKVSKCIPVEADLLIKEYHKIVR